MKKGGRGRSRMKKSRRVTRSMMRKSLKRWEGGVSFGTTAPLPHCPTSLTVLPFLPLGDGLHHVIFWQRRGIWWRQRWQHGWSHLLRINVTEPMEWSKVSGAASHPKVWTVTERKSLRSALELIPSVRAIAVEQSVFIVLSWITWTDGSALRTLPALVLSGRWP